MNALNFKRLALITLVSLAGSLSQAATVECALKSKDLKQGHYAELHSIGTMKDTYDSITKLEENYLLTLIKNADDSVSVSIEDRLAEVTNQVIAAKVEAGDFKIIAFAFQGTGDRSVSVFCKAL